jgi:hypothetical protein
LTLLSLTTKYTHGDGARNACWHSLSVTTRFAPLVMGLRDIRGKHMITESSASARITIVALHQVVFGLSYLYFPKGGTMPKIIE